MSSPFAFPIDPSTATGRYLTDLGIASFEALTQHIRRLAYGRPTSGSLIAVLEENRGTCSSKHRLLAAVAHESGHPQIRLVVGIYAMAEANTPGVGAVLATAGVDCIPEAHCYLKVDGVRYDFTGLGAGTASPFAALIEEHEVAPASLAQTKADLHQRALATWASHHDITCERAWQLREACIAALAATSTAVQIPR